ncbi:MAG: LOG family protein, partial [Mariprofundaceae bacterium]|nr:LOG family protein [Mariprofundaceae bacterium]
AWLVLPGGLGTLAEFAMSWDLAAIGVLEPRPLILYGEMWQAMMPTLSQHLLFSQSTPLPLLQLCTTPDEVLSALAGTLPSDAIEACE